MIYNTLMQYLNREVHSGIINSDLSSIILDISSAAIELSNLINRNIFDIVPVSPDTTNTHGENQHRLDIKAHNLFLFYLQKGSCCNYLISEESEKTIELSDVNYTDHINTVCIDPLDGSSNVDLNIPVGSIFSVYSQQKNISNPYLHSIKSGKEQRIAGYILYGTSTMFVLTCGNGVHGFTLDLQSMEFILTHSNIKIKKNANTYAINEGHAEAFPNQIRQYLGFCKQYDPESHLPYTSRYIGSMVVNMHRILMQGGIFLYPSTRAHPKGKLRLLYECNPIAFIVEQAGGLAIDGM